MKVAFGKVWKESLTELSGGQRSLLALSLILALLLFKPAPMYILDEVRAGQLARNSRSEIWEQGGGCNLDPSGPTWFCVA